MQKYKITASKNQKKYTLVISAESASNAKEKVHQDGYSVLNVDELLPGQISGKKFIFQVEKDGEVKSGAIIGIDIFKVYVKLRQDLGYTILSLFPQGDEAEKNDQKRKEILKKLEEGFRLKTQKKEKEVGVKEKKEESFYIQKKLSQTNALIEKVLHKIEGLITEKSGVSPEKREKIQGVYEKLVHVKGTTNIIKLQEIGELALEKIAEIELDLLEKDRNKESVNLLNETNSLLKQMGSSKHFVEPNRDYKKKIQLFFQELQEKLSLKFLKETLKSSGKKKREVDTHSYSYLKTVLLLNTYKKKRSELHKEMQKNFFLYCNPFRNSEQKERFFIKKKVIEQNISLLQAKKSGRISSYTSAKKGIGKVIDILYSLGKYIGINFYTGIVIFAGIFLVMILLTSNNIIGNGLSPSSLRYILPIFVVYVVFVMLRHHFISIVGILTLSFLFFFIQVNF